MIDSYGWSDALQQDFQRNHAGSGLEPARVLVQQRGRYRIAAAGGEFEAEAAGRLMFEAAEGGLPVTGDWVAAAVRPDEGSATIRAVLPRRTQFVRKAAFESRPQIVAANVDVALLVASLNADLNVRRLERYLAAAWESGALPSIVLTKADLSDAVADAVAEVQRVALGVPVLPVSSVTGAGLDAVRAQIGTGRTAVLLGSSGVGKSTLVNALAGEELMATKAIREDDAKGRHTTTHRELVLLPDGGLLLDTPGMRELGLWDSDGGLSATFEDVEAIAAQCRFSDCGHGREPGCAIQAALADGSLEAARWQSYGKLQRELAHEHRKESWVAREAERRVWMSRHKAYRQQQKFRDQQE